MKKHLKRLISCMLAAMLIVTGVFAGNVVPVLGATAAFTLVGGGNESIYAQLSGVTAAQVTAVSYSGAMTGSLSEEDLKYLVRDYNSGVRIDIPGIKAGTYSLEVTTAVGNLSKTGIEVEAYDRSGYAHFNYKDGVGAYKDDGTLKDNAIVLYVTDENKNTVTLSYGGVTVTGIGNILNSVGKECNEAGHEGQCKMTSDDKTYYAIANENKGIIEMLGRAGVPLVIRIVGVVSDSGLYKCGTFDAKSASLINGLTAYDSRDYGGSEGDNGHMARIKSGKDITIEGIGPGAAIDGWGLHFMAESATTQAGLGKSFEVRNLIFMNNPEDAIGMEGVQSGSKITAPVERCWIHNNEFYCPSITNPAESDKKDGDGSCDFKRGMYLTCSYNYFEGCHKTNLVGSSDSSLQFNLSYHHNIWKNCKARMPLGRQANMHFYNNIFIGITDYAIQSRANAYIFSEYNLFYMCKNPMDVKSGSGAIKSYNNSLSSYINNLNCTIVTDKKQTVPNSCAYDGVSYSKFDTDAKLSYIPSGNYLLQENITEMVKYLYAKNGTLSASPVKPEDVTMSDVSIMNYLGLKVTPQEISTFPTTLTPGKIQKSVYAFTVPATSDVTIQYASDALSATGCIVNEAGECMLVASGTAYNLTAGTYYVQPYNFQPGGMGVNPTPGTFKDMTINSITIESGDPNYDPNKLQSISLNETSKTLLKDATFELRVSFLPSTATDKTVTWTSDNTSVATVANGVVTAKAIGTANITAACGDKTATCKVTVSEPVAINGIKLNQDTATVKAGSTVILEASPLPANTTETLGTVTWTSSDASVATVSAGTVTGIKEGTATITAAYGSFSASCAVTVEKAPELPAGDMVYNVTEKGNSGSSFYTITANTSAQSRIYNGVSFTKSLKMESSTSISFKAASAGTLTLVFGAVDGKKVKVDGTSYEIPDTGILEVDLAAGSHDIKKDTTDTFLFYMAYVPDASDSGSDTPSVTEYTVTVTGGTASPTKAEAGATVTITADNVSGKAFKNWTVTSGGAALANASSATTTFTMPAANVAVEANYETVGGGETSGDYQDTEIPEGGLVTTEVYGNPAEVKFTVLEDMPAKTDQEVAEYDTYYQGTNSPTVTNGIPTAGAAFKIEAAKDATVKFVVRNIGKSTDSAKTYYVADASGKTVASASMGSGTIKAVPIEFEMTAGSTYYLYVKSSKIMVYEFGYAVKNTGTNPGENPEDTMEYTVTVTGGTASVAKAKAGATVTITADNVSGKNFKNWTVTSGGAALANASNATTTFTMPAANVAVTANYETAGGENPGDTPSDEPKNGLSFEGDVFKYYENDTWVSDKYAFVEFDGARFLVANGTAATHMNGLAQDPEHGSDWYYVAAGKIQEQTQGLVEYDDEWFYVQNGKMDATYNGYVEYDGGKFLVAEGRIVREATGLVQDPNSANDWYFLAAGQKVEYTGLAMYDNEWFYVVDGRLAVEYTGNVEYNGETFFVVSGMYRTDLE